MGPEWCHAIVHFVIPSGPSNDRVAASHAPKRVRLPRAARSIKLFWLIECIPLMTANAKLFYVSAFCDGIRENYVGIREMVSVFSFVFTEKEKKLVVLR